MVTDLLRGLLAEHWLLALLLGLLALEMLKVRAGAAVVLVRIALLGACAVVLWQLAQGYEQEIVPGEIRIDRYALLAKAVLLACALLMTLIVPIVSSFKSASLLTGSLIGALIVMDSSGFISLVLGIELLSLPAFALMMNGTGETTASEAAIKYLVLSSVASALLLFGIAFAYGATGSLSIEAFEQLAVVGSPEGTAATLLIASGFCLKAAVFPFHAWAPDAYAGSTLPVTSFLASIVKGAVILAFARVFATAPPTSTTLAIVIALSILSIGYGNTAALKQTTFRRLLAYSSIAHAGYMLFAFADTTGARLHDLLWYVGIYAAMVILACASFAVLCPDGRDDLDALDGAFHRRPLAAVLFGLAMLSLAGLPPLPGFFAKLFVFSSVIASGHVLAASIAFIGSFIGVTYYASLFFRLFASDATAPAERQES